MENNNQNLEAEQNYTQAVEQFLSIYCSKQTVFALSNLYFCGANAEEVAYINNVNKQIGQMAQQRNKSLERVTAFVEGVLARFNAKFQLTGSMLDDSLKTLTINGITYSIWESNIDFDYIETVKMISGLLANYEEYSKLPKVIEYENLLTKMNGKGIFSGITRAVAELKMNDLKKDPYVKAYLDIKNNLDVLTRLDRVFKSNEFRLLAKNASTAQEQLIKSEQYVQKIDSKHKARAYDALSLAFIRLYLQNQDHLRAKGSKPLQTLLNDVQQGVDMSTKNMLNKIVNDFGLLLPAYEQAVLNHENFRKCRIKEDGIVEADWRPIQDATYVIKLQQMETLPENIRLNNGIYEQDVANSSFDELSLDFQLVAFREQIANNTKNIDNGRQ